MRGLSRGGPLIDSHEDPRRVGVCCKVLEAVAMNDCASGSSPVDIDLRPTPSVTGWSRDPTTCLQTINITLLDLSYSPSTTSPLSYPSPSSCGTSTCVYLWTPSFPVTSSRVSVHRNLKKACASPGRAKVGLRWASGTAGESVDWPGTEMYLVFAVPGCVPGTCTAVDVCLECGRRYRYFRNGVRNQHPNEHCKQQI